MNSSIEKSVVYERLATLADDSYKNAVLNVPEYLSEWYGPYGTLKGQSILDFGCKSGEIALGLSLFSGATRVVGVDFFEAWSGVESLAREKIGIDQTPESLSYTVVGKNEFISSVPGKFNFIFSWSFFELLSLLDIEPIIKSFYQKTHIGGHVLIQMGRTYYSQYGSNLERFGVKAWEHLMSPNEVIRRKVMLHSDSSVEEKEFFWSQFESLNRLTPSQLVAVFESNGFHLARRFDERSNAKVPDALMEVFNPSALTHHQSILLFTKA
jgi:hypothetical protein